MDSDWETTGSAKYADAESDQCEIRRAFDKAPNIPIAGTTTVTALNKKLQKSLLLLDDAVPLRAIDVLPFDSSAHQEPSRRMGHLSQPADCHLGRPECIPVDEGAD